VASHTVTPTVQWWHVCIWQNNQFAAVLVEDLHALTASHGLVSGSSSACAAGGTSRPNAAAALLPYQLMVLLVAHGMQQLQTHHHITSQHSRKDSSTAAGVLLAPSGCACMCSQLAHIVNVKMGKFCYFPCLVHSFPLLLLLLVVLVCCCNASFALCSIHTAAVSEHCID
jgi:hypothetical protein